MTAINNDNALPDFQKAVIQSLGENFIQLYTKPKGQKLETTAFWPAKIKGQAILKSKGSSKDPVGNKISVEVSPGKLASYTAPETAGGEPPASADTDDLDDVSQPQSRITARSKGAEPEATDKELGRKRRKK
jgi:predicted ribonuclease toxin of YeeF-YezG toxin-antitoxin module